MSQLEAHCLTLVLEALTCTLVIAITRWAPTLRRWLLVCACASLLTHPFAWWANHALPWAPWPRVAVIEGAVVATEALIYWRLASVNSIDSNRCTRRLGPD